MHTKLNEVTSRLTAIYNKAVLVQSETVLERKRLEARNFLKNNNNNNNNTANSNSSTNISNSNISTSSYSTNLAHLHQQINSKSASDLSKNSNASTSLLNSNIKAAPTFDFIYITFVEPYKNLPLEIHQCDSNEYYDINSFTDTFVYSSPLILENNCSSASYSSLSQNNNNNKNNNNIQPLTINTSNLDTNNNGTNSNIHKINPNENDPMVHGTVIGPDGLSYPAGPNGEILYQKANFKVEDIVNNDGLIDNLDNLENLRFETSPTAAQGRVSSTKPISHKCPQCNYRSAWRSCVLTHMKLKHSNQRPWHCSICTKSYKLKHHLKQHMETAHGSTPTAANKVGGDNKKMTKKMRENQKKLEALLAQQEAYSLKMPEEFAINNSSNVDLQNFEQASDELMNGSDEQYLELAKQFLNIDNGNSINVSHQVSNNNDLTPKVPIPKLESKNDQNNNNKKSEDEKKFNTLEALLKTAFEPSSPKNNNNDQPSSSSGTDMNMNNKNDQDLVKKDIFQQILEGTNSNNNNSSGTNQPTMAPPGTNIPTELVVPPGTYVGKQSRHSNPSPKP